MKNKTSAFLLISMIITALLGATSCYRSEHTEQQLLMMDTLSDENPDTVLTMLDSMDFNAMSKSERMHAELLRGKAMNKAYVNFTTDSVMLEVVDWYERHGNANQKMMAYYILGCAYRDLEDALSALKYLNLAVDAVDESDEDCDLSTLMRVYSQMGGLYQRVAAFENERIADMHAERLAWQIGDTISALRLMWAQACCLYDSRNQSEAIMILDSIAQITEKNGFQKDPDLIYPIKTDYYLERKEIKCVETLIREYEYKTGILTESLDTLNYDMAHFYRKGKYYNIAQKPDSAIQMFNKLLHLLGQRPLYTSQRYGLKEVSYQGLAEAYSLQHQHDSVIKYANLYCQWNDSSTRAKSSEHLLRYQSLYNYTKIQEQALKAEQKASHLRVTMILLVVIGMAIAIIVWSIYQKRLKKERQKQIATNKEYQLLLHELEKSADELLLVKTDSERFQREKESEIQKLQTALAMYQDNEQSVEQWSDERAIFACDIAKHLHSLSSHAQKATPNELNCLLVTAQNAFPKFYANITDASKGLSHTEIIISILIRFRFIPSEISLLLGLSSQRITNLKSSVNQKLFGTQGAKTLDSHLMSLK
ncbi:MAG: hypothetical protein IJC23_09345 [Bacteroidaceae bacterium]|nr:hypothetical protein [Bacteroidaceae bacterium]